jgi:DNA-binding CsgD family transcriptional regulator
MHLDLSIVGNAATAARDIVPDIHLLHDAAVAALDIVPDVLVLLDRAGCIIYRNRAADNLLRRNDPLTSDGGIIGAVFPADTVGLRKLIADAANTAEHGEEQSRGDLVLRGQGSLSLLISIAPLRYGPNFDSRRPNIILLASYPDLAGIAGVDIQLKLLYGLTQAEARIAVALANGMTITRAAAAYSITRETAKTHLKHTFDKLGVRRQAELVRLIAGVTALRVPNESRRI